MGAARVPGKCTPLPVLTLGTSLSSTLPVGLLAGAFLCPGPNLYLPCLSIVRPPLRAPCLAQSRPILTTEGVTVPQHGPEL